MCAVVDERGGGKKGGLGLFGSAVLGGFVVAVALVVLLLVSPAAFVSLMPGWVATEESNRNTELVLAGLCAAAAGAMALLLRGRAPVVRGVFITLLLVVASVFGLHATTSERTPVPENTCVAYSGGSHTCPGG